MELLFFILSASILTCIQLLITRFFIRQLATKLIAAITSATIIPPVQQTENEATTVKEEGIEFSEHTPLDLPSDVKFEIEGGDSMSPPGYATS